MLIVMSGIRNRVLLLLLGVGWTIVLLLLSGFWGSHDGWTTQPNASRASNPVSQRDVSNLRLPSPEQPECETASGGGLLRRLQELGLSVDILDLLAATNPEILTKFVHDAKRVTVAPDDGNLPPDTTVRCLMQGDASDVCEYRNAVCFDLPTDETAVSSPVLHVVEAAQGGPLAQLVGSRNLEGFSYDFADSMDPELFKPRVMPFSSSKLLVDVIKPAATVAAMLGGTFPGVVTWVDDMYVLQNALGSHLWGWAFSVGQPLFGMLHANISQQLQLPPLKNLLLLSTDAGLQLHVTQAWRDGTAYSGSGTDRWAREFLDALLEYSRDLAAGDGGSEKQSARVTAAPTDDSFSKTSLYANYNEMLEHGASMAAACVAAAAVGDVSDLHEALADLRVLYPALPKAAEGAAAVLTAAMQADPTLELQSAVLATVCALQWLHGGTFLGRDHDILPPAPPPRYLLPLLRDSSISPRLWFTTRAAAFHPMQFAIVSTLTAAFPQFLSTDVEGNPAALALRELLVSSLERVPHRVCAKAGVFAGTRENLVSGIAEANHLRKFAAAKLGTPSAFNKWPPARLLLVDRATETPDSSDFATKYSRYFVNRVEMEAVIQKYELPYTLLTDQDIYRMSLAEQAQTFAAHGILVVVHGATEVNAMFLPPHSAVIEVSPFLTWCPVFTRMLTASGHHTFPIFSKLKSPALSYSFTWGISPNRSEFMRMVEEFAVRCDDKGFALASSDPECWHELRMTSAHTPIHEFEHQLLQAMEAIGSPRFHRGSAIARLHGIPENGPPPPLVQPNYYTNCSWYVTPPENSAASAVPQGIGRFG